MEVNLTPVIKESFLQFGGAVLQSRALPDARDLMKPSARQIFYCLYTDKFVHEKPFQKTLKAIGSCFRMYIHGDSSAEGIIMRAGQPFAMRYPLVDVEGSYGTLLASGSWSAPRYTSARLSALANYLFSDIQKEVIDEWRDNYDNTERYPMVLPSKGFFNLVNGSYGIGVGASCSCPQYNLRELNEALIKLLWNSNIDFEEIYCAPDFATGAVLLNAADVKESHRNGTGAACKLRSVISWDSKERCLVVTEIPYMVYTETICSQLEEIINSENNPGIERFNDLTGKTPLIKIYLTKNANPDKVIKYLYKNTSLQTHYGVNFTFLEDGRYPRIFNWKGLLQAHLVHEKDVYLRSFTYDLRKIKARLHILEGLIKAISMIDEVVKTIKACANVKNASIGLQRLLSIDEAQAKAILDLKLSRLTHLDITKLENEKTLLEKEKLRIEAILSDENLLKKEIEKGLREVAEKFGDARRTQILDIQNEETDELTEVRLLQVSLTNKNRVYTIETSTLYTQRKGTVGKKVKLDKGEYIMETCSLKSNEEILFFAKSGMFYHCPAASLPIDELIYTSALFTHGEEQFCNICGIHKNASQPYILFVTKNGLLKKSLLSEYNIKKSGGVRAIALDEGDKIVSVLFLNEEKIGIMSQKGNFLIIETSDIRPIGRVTRGVKGIKLNIGDCVAAAHVVPEGVYSILSISAQGLAKRTDFSEFSVQGKNTKGSKLQSLTSGDSMTDFKTLMNENEITIVSTHSSLKIKVDEISLLSRGAQGSRVIKLGGNDNVVVLL